ncbi:GNAT family N-acetyltransferase [Streptomyces sp. NBC_01525]|uniref:GNAT family N-acetyltransferase n=1 Tax=Streptomyces sp. NBC_01525 TaxID=2903893 RepID=UPI00386F68E1
MEFMTDGRAEVRITHADVGKRVSVRRRTDDSAGQWAFTDAVGVLTSWTDGVLIITRRNGEQVRVGEELLVAAKVVPAAPARRRGPAADVRELTEVAARGWPAVETAHLGGWTLRASGGFTRRANSVLPLGDPGVPLDEALAHTVRWYTARSLPPVIAVTTGRPDATEELADGLERRGWTASGHTLVRTAALAPLADTGADLTRVRLDRAPDAAWLARYHRAEGPVPEARAVLTGGPSVWFATVEGADGGTEAIGRCVVDGRWAGFAAVEVAPGARRRGLARLVMAALAARALDEGASAAYLQVEADNAAALGLYDGLGFTDHHGYHYRAAPAAVAP